MDKPNCPPKGQPTPTGPCPQGVLYRLDGIDALSNTLFRWSHDVLLEMRRSKELFGAEFPHPGPGVYMEAYLSIIFAVVVNTAHEAVRTGDPDLVRKMAKSLDDWFGTQTINGQRMSEFTQSPLICEPYPTPKPADAPASPQAAEPQPTLKFPTPSVN